jgi:hypothetical protein
MAMTNTILPGLGDVLDNTKNVDVPQKLTSGILGSFFGFGTATGETWGQTERTPVFSRATKIRLF